MKQMNSLEKASVPLSLSGRTVVSASHRQENLFERCQNHPPVHKKSIERAQIAAGQTPHLPTCGAQKADSAHPAGPLPTDREERNRRESARRHADIAEAQGKSAEEIHEISKRS